MSSHTISSASTSCPSSTLPAAPFPAPLLSTDDYSSALLQFGVTTLKPLQLRAVSTILQQRDAFVFLSTGYGKSLCFQLPAVLHAQREPGSVTIVISPLIALMQDQVAALRKRGIAAAMLGSAVDASEKKRVLSELFRPLASAALPARDNLPAELTHDFDGVPVAPPSLSIEADKRRVALLYLSPEYVCSEGGRKLLHHLTSTGRLKFIAIDEVHCVSQWGHSFRRDYLGLSFLKESYPSIPLMMLTASATKRVQRDILQTLKVKSNVEMIVDSANRANISYSVEFKECIKTLQGEEMTIFQHMKNFVQKCASNIVKNESKPNNTAPASKPNPFTLAAGIVKPPTSIVGSKSSTAAAASSGSSSNSPPAGFPKMPETPASPICSGIVYTRTRDDCECIAHELRKLCVPAAAYHAGMSTNLREYVQQEWMKDRINIIVATTAFGMGIDKANVRFVIHHEMTPDLEGYSQETGRAGRDGLPAAALLYYSQNDLRLQRFLCQQEGGKGSGGEGKEGKSWNPRAALSLDERLAMLEKVMQYAETLTCRRALLVKYFGETLKDTDPSVVLARKEKRCCDVCTDLKHVAQRLTLAKSIGQERASGANMGQMKSEYVFGGAKTGDEYESAEERRLTEKQLERRKQELQDAKVQLPKNIVLDKSSNAQDRMMDYLEEAERKAQRRDGEEEKSYVKVTGAQLSQAAAAERKRKLDTLRSYKGSILGVEEQIIKDLPNAKREEMLTKFLQFVTTNRTFAKGDTSTSDPQRVLHSDKEIAAALEYLCFKKSTTASTYSGFIRSALQNLSAANKARTSSQEIESIQWKNIPLRTSDGNEDDSSSSSSDSSSSDDDDEEDRPIKTQKVSAKQAASGSFKPASASFSGFQSAASAMGKTMPKNTTPNTASSSQSAGGFRSASSLVPASRSSIVGSKTNLTTVPRPTNGPSSTSTISSSSHTSPSKPQLSFFTSASQLEKTAAKSRPERPLLKQATSSTPRTDFKPNIGIVGSTPSSTSSLMHVSPARPERPVTSSKQPSPRTPAVASSSNIGNDTGNSPSPGSANSSSGSSSGSTHRMRTIKYAKPLALSWAHPTEAAQQHQAELAKLQSTNAAAASSNNHSSPVRATATSTTKSPPRIRPLTFSSAAAASSSTCPSTSTTTATASNIHDSPSKKPRLELHSSSTSTSPIPASAPTALPIILEADLSAH